MGNDLIALQEKINGMLADMNEETVPTESQTHAIEAATPSMQESSPQPGAETAVPMTEGTPDPGAETPVVMTEGTQPAGGETPEGTQPAGGETPEGTQPAGGETSEGPSAQVSTAKPGRLLFEKRRRSRGSIF